MYVRPSVLNNLALTGRILMKLVFEDFPKIDRENLILVQIQRE